MQSGRVVAHTIVPAQFGHIAKGRHAPCKHIALVSLFNRQRARLLIAVGVVHRHKCGFAHGAHRRVVVVRHHLVFVSAWQQIVVGVARSAHGSVGNELPVAVDVVAIHRASLVGIDADGIDQLGRVSAHHAQHHILGAGRQRKVVLLPSLGSGHTSAVDKVGHIIVVGRCEHLQFAVALGLGHVARHKAEGKWCCVVGCDGHHQFGLGFSLAAQSHAALCGIGVGQGKEVVLVGPAIAAERRAIAALFKTLVGVGRECGGVNHGHIHIVAIRCHGGTHIGRCIALCSRIDGYSHGGRLCRGCAVDVHRLHLVVVSARCGERFAVSTLCYGGLVQLHIVAVHIIATQSLYRTEVEVDVARARSFLQAECEQLVALGSAYNTHAAGRGILGWFDGGIVGQTGVPQQFARGKVVGTEFIALVPALLKGVEHAVVVSRTGCALERGAIAQLGTVQRGVDAGLPVAHLKSAAPAVEFGHIGYVSANFGD